MTQISHVRGIQGVYPDVSKLGKQFKPASQLIKQIAAIRDEARRADMRVQELTAEVEHQRVQHDHARAVALRNSQPEPSPRELHCAERTLKKAQQRSQDARRATEMVERDLRELLAEKGEEYGEFALEFVREADREREELLARLAQVEADASAYRGLYEWSTNTDKYRTFAPVAADDHQWRQRMLERDPANYTDGVPVTTRDTGFADTYTPAV